MLKKSEVIESFNNLPEDVSADMLIERILLLKRIDRGLEQALKNDTVSHLEVMDELKAWRRKQN